MNIRLLICIGTALFSLSLSATSTRYRAMWRTDPATSMVIGWEQESGLSPVIYYRPAANPQMAWTTKAPDKLVTAMAMRNYFARLEGLQPNTRYEFEIRDSEGSNERLYFQTAPASNDSPLTFAVGGDSRNNRKARRAINRLVAKLQPLAVIFSGDMTDRSSNGEWQEWLDDWQLTITADRRLIPLIAARGNHEPRDQVLLDLFDLPHPRAYYALSFGKDLFRLYTLNSLAPASGTQASWLSQDLDQIGHRHRWRMAQYHHPIRPHTLRKKERLKQWSAWAPLFEKYQVQLVQESDAHVAKVTWPIRPSTAAGSEEGFIRDDQKGTVYIGEGCWGAPLRPANDAKSWTRAIGAFHHLTWLTVTPDALDIAFVKSTASEDAQALPRLSQGELPAGTILWPIDGQPGLTIAHPEASSIAELEDAVAADRPLIDLANRNHLQVPYQLATSGEVEIRFLNLRRQVVKRKRANRNAGKYLDTVTVHDLPSGRFLLEVHIDGQLVIQRLVQK